MSSPGTGVQQRASLTHTSPASLTITPASPVDPAAGDRGRRGPLGQLLLGVLDAAELRDQPLHHVPGGGVPLADGRVQRAHVGVVQLLGQRGHRVGRHQALHRQADPAHLLGDRLLADLDRLFLALLGEPLLDLGAWPAGEATKDSQSRVGPAPSAFDVKISTTSPFSSLRSSATSRPFTRAPMQRCPTSVCTA